jgi:5-methyltetrahydrofolate--homocysteine methyltransferase
MKERGLSIPVILGGAALTRRYVEQDLRPIYTGNVYYANDAFDGLRLMESIKDGNGPEVKTEQPTKKIVEESLTGSEAKIALVLAEEDKAEGAQRSAVNRMAPIPRPPFWGSKVIEEIPLDDVFAYLNEVALIRGQWRVVKGKLSAEEYKKILDEQIYPELVQLKKRVKKERLLQPKVVYGYFPCQSKGNDLIIYQPPSPVSKFDFKVSQLKEWLRFSFPRQTDDRNLCIADYFASVESRRIDVVAFHLVTVGKVASEYSKRLYKANSYKDYLYFHGLSVESAEALAELWHKRIREELGIVGKDAPETKRLFGQGYQGSRYSFGYPACPNLEDQAKLFKLIDPGRIRVKLTEEFQLDPEQSTSAIIVHHPDARYFIVKN